MDDKIVGDAAYNAELDPTNTTNEPVEDITLDVDDERLVKMLVQSLDANASHWEQVPWQLTTTDKENINYLLGDQIDRSKLLPHQTPYVDNRLHAAVRAILAYATGQTAKPDLLPSKPDDNYQRVAQNMGQFLYQHSLDHEVNSEMRLGLKNVVTRKRGALKFRFNENYGPFGDICTENVDPADVIVGRFAGYRNDPEILYFRQKCSVEELVGKFPDKREAIFTHFGFKRGVHTQLSRMITYYECWFSYFDDNFKAKEGLCWFLPDSTIILDKMPNPNWIYTGDEQEERLINITDRPIKPFVWLNYLNTGRSFIDETCLLDQAIPLQDILNKRGRQIVETADYANPRVLIDKRVMEQADAERFINKHPKTIGLVDTSATGNDMQKASLVIPAPQLPAFVMQDKIDARSEIDTMMGTPVQFRGEQPQSKNPTLGQDLLVRNQAAALQDDLVGVVNLAWRDYYKKLLQMCTVYLDDNYWLMTRGQDGEYMNLSLHSTELDTNVRIGVQVDSNLPLDKPTQRSTAIQLAQIPGMIDPLSLYEMIGIPNAKQLAARVEKYNLDRLTYASSIEQQMFNAEAETDINLIVAGKVPEERDDYPAAYFNYWNIFMTTNRFMKLSLAVQQALAAFLHAVADRAATTEALRDSILDPAGMIDRPVQPPGPEIKVFGNLSPQDSAQVAGLAPKAQPANAQAGAAGGSPPKVTNPNQFGP